jgi:cell division cycle protein 20 (cofactor of APC complex)
MNSIQQSTDYSTPKQRILRNSSLISSQSRYLNSRKIDSVPGFDLGTPTNLETSEICPLYKQLKPNKLTLQGTSLTRIGSILSIDQSIYLPSDHHSEYRPLPTQADKILDAPEIIDDYYLNLLSWSDNNMLAVALRNKLYLWNGENGSVSQLLEYPNDLITSVSWMRGGSCVAVGDSCHSIKLFDLNKFCEVRTMSNHTDRVSSLAWNGYVLSSGSRDSSILQHDMRVQSYFVKLSSHCQEVCGLRWNESESLLASGGNDNKVCIWEMGNMAPLGQLKEHKAAVKALAWCPWKNNVLATGGGSSDRCIKLWDVSDNHCFCNVDTGSQVSALEWNRHEKEVLSAHGYCFNQLALWNAGKLEKVAEFHGHTARILALAQSPKGDNVVTAGADETLRFWSVFKSRTKKSEDELKKTPEGSWISHR